MPAQDKLLSGRYLIVEPLGRGGMAAVYRGTDRVLGRTVAIKVLNPELAEDQRFVERFRHEARAAAALNHPGVVGVFDTGSDGDQHYIVMEHLEGRTLAEVLRDERPLPPERALSVAAEVAEALEAAHRAGLVHRDVKPSNVMIMPNGTVKVMDFGIARAAAGASFTQTGMVMGTATYFSPEQARSDPVDARSDIYSLGAVLYEMLTGRPPFTGATAVAVATKHVREQPVPPSVSAPGLPDACDPVVMRALAKDPAGRFGSARAFADALRSARAALRGGTGELGATRPMGPGVLLPDPAATAPIDRDSTAVLPASAARAPHAAPAPVGPVRRAPPSAAPPGRRRTWWPAVLILLVIALAAGLVAWLLLSDQPGRQAVAPPASTGAPTTPASPSPTPTPAQPATVDQAAANLAQVVADGVNAGEVSDAAARDIQHGARDALKAYDHGDVEEATHKLDELSHQVDELTDKGEITSQDRADRIKQAITQLQEAMAAGGQN